MVTVKINRTRDFRTSDNRVVHSTVTPNGLKADIVVGESIRLYGNFVAIDADGLEKTSETYTDRTHKVGHQVNVLVGRELRNGEGELISVNEEFVRIRPYGAKTARRVPLYIFSAMNR